MPLALHRVMTLAVRHQPAPESATFVFTDIVDSTEMTVRLGDHEALRVMDAHDTIVRAACAAHDGLEVEQKGDSFLLAFATADRGVCCALEIQRALARYRRSNPEPLRVRSGVHTGTALRCKDGYFGSAVVLTARVCAAARANETLVTSAAAAASGRTEWGPPRIETFKGFRQPQMVLAIEWAEQALPAWTEPSRMLHRSSRVAVTL